MVTVERGTRCAAEAAARGRRLRSAVSAGAAASAAGAAMPAPSTAPRKPPPPGPAMRPAADRLAVPPVACHASLRMSQIAATGASSSAVSLNVASSRSRCGAASGVASGVQVPSARRNDSHERLAPREAGFRRVELRVARREDAVERLERCGCPGAGSRRSSRCSCRSPHPSPPCSSNWMAFSTISWARSPMSPGSTSASAKAAPQCSDRGGQSGDDRGLDAASAGAPDQSSASTRWNPVSSGSFSAVRPGAGVPLMAVSRSPNAPYAAPSVS